MRAVCARYVKSILALILTVQTLCLCCVFSACTSADAMESSPVVDAVASVSADPVDNYSRWLNAHYSAATATRGEWLSVLMTYVLGQQGVEAPDDPEALFEAAYSAGIIDSFDCRPYAVLTRGYAAHTLMRALRYEPVTVIPVSDAADDPDMLTLVYYGYFVPDEENCVRPDAPVTGEECAALQIELSRCAALKGKRMLSFGDSIMFGVGNKGEGITDMIADKYGMIAVDYSMCRATLGLNPGVNHIPDQIRKAIEAGESADLILLNGGTNDMLHVPLGETGEGFTADSFDENTFSGGLETSLSLIRQTWGATPILFIRAHNMDICDDATERIYGECARSIAEKWSVPVADIYRDTGFNTEDPAIRDQHTFYKEQISRTDSIHPTASGYAKYYLPAVCRMIAELLI